MEKSALIDTIESSISSTEGIVNIQPIDLVDARNDNELVLFMKPELFLVEEKEKIRTSIALVLDKFDEFKVEMHGITTLDGTVLDRTSIMNSHYGFINRLSRSASKILTDQEKEKMASSLNIRLDEHGICGGHEYLEQFPAEDLDSLSRLWFSKDILKLRSGFYYQAYDKDGGKIILVNGFHPAQLDHFTEPSHHIVLFLLHSNTNWKTLKNQMVGATFPEKADPVSIRGHLYATPAKYGLEAVSIANNGVHLSAGPFEAIHEIYNFYGKIDNIEPRKNPSLGLKKMVAAGVEMEAALSTLKNPIFQISDRKVDLYTATEDMDTADGISFWKENEKNIVGYSQE